MKKHKTLLMLAAAIGISCAASAQTLDWARLSNNTNAVSVSADASGNSYSLAFNVLEKRNSGGTLIWSKEIHIAGPVMDATVDRLGNIYITGFYLSDMYEESAILNGGTDHGIWFENGTSLSLPGNIVPDGNLLGYKLFFGKADVNGNMLWVKSFSQQTDYTYGQALATDASNNVYLLGSGSNYMDFGGGQIITTTFGQFVAKFNSAGQHIYSHQVQSNYSATPNPTPSTNNNIAVNDNGDLVVSGEFSGTTTFNTATSQTNLTSAGSSDIFQVRYNTSGVFQWIKQFGSSGTELCYGSLIDNSGNSYCYGLFSGTVDFNPNRWEYNKTASGLNDMFIVSLTSTATFRWASTFGGTGSESTFAVTQTDFDLHASGGFSGTVDFNPGTAVNNLTSAGGTDIFTLGLTKNNGAYTHCYRNGSTGNDIVTDICSIPVTGNLALFQIGTFEGTVNFQPVSGTTNLTSSSNSKMCVIKTEIGDPSGRFAGSFTEATSSAVYPNPFSDNIHLSLGNAEQTFLISVYTIDGRLVLSSTVSGSNEFNLDLSGLNSGIYLMNIQSEGKTEQHKIVKQ